MEVQTRQHNIYEFGGQKVMLDFDWAALYDIEAMTPKQAVPSAEIREPQERTPSDRVSF